jgi:protein-S-isoprenylcysteine O-methyltransferase Ste14
VFVVFWIATAFSTKRTVRRVGGWRLVFFIILVGYFVVRLGFLHAAWMNGVVWQRTLATGLAADAIALAGLAVMLWARVVLGRNWSADVVLKEGHELVTRGPYRWVRHPIYSGLLLLALGLGGVAGAVERLLGTRGAGRPPLHQGAVGGAAHDPALRRCLPELQGAREGARSHVV